ncbi:RidA family protein [Rhodoligotrophos ferricapiens]|uniref:RidA family protein n=1 Tax=Rhodoligotrophos ferricapiens TaxID=3069264 RepID=UPI00315D4426
MQIEQRLAELGIALPMQTADEKDYYGQKYGKMRPYYRSGEILFLSGHTAGMRDGKVLYPGVLGKDVSIEQGYEAARLTGLNCLAGIKEAIGDLDRVTGLIRSLNFVACAPGFTEPHLVASGLTDLFADVFGEEIGVGPRATIGVTSLADNYCFETWMTVAVR